MRKRSNINYSNQMAYLNDMLNAQQKQINALIDLHSIHSDMIKDVMKIIKLDAKE